MSADKELSRLKAQQEAQAMRIQRMEMQANQQQRQNYQPDEQVYQTTTDDLEPEYNQVVDQEALINSITQRVTQQVTQQVHAQQGAQQGVDNRMKRLIEKYPAIQQDDSPLTKQARDEYARISRENPGLISVDKASAYELAVETAAARMGARPLNQDYNPMQDYTLSANHGNLAAKGGKSGMNFLTPKIVANFEIFAKNHPDFNLDPSTPQGKKNLEELNEYSERFHANVDESHIRYK